MPMTASDSFDLNITAIANADEAGRIATAALKSGFAATVAIDGAAFAVRVRIPSMMATQLVTAVPKFLADSVDASLTEAVRATFRSS